MRSYMNTVTNFRITVIFLQYTHRYDVLSNMILAAVYTQCISASYKAALKKNKGKTKPLNLKLGLSPRRQAF